MIGPILGVITLVLTIVWGVVKYYHSIPYEKAKVWNEFRDLEKKYREALAAGDPATAADLDKRMRDLRAQYDYLNR